MLPGLQGFCRALGDPHQDTARPSLTSPSSLDRNQLLDTQFYVPLAHASALRPQICETELGLSQSAAWLLHADHERADTYFGFESHVSPFHLARETAPTTPVSPAHCPLPTAHLPVMAWRVQRGSQPNFCFGMRFNIYGMSTDTGTGTGMAMPWSLCNSTIKAQGTHSSISAPSPSLIRAQSWPLLIYSTCFLCLSLFYILIITIIITPIFSTVYTYTHLLSVLLCCFIPPWSSHHPTPTQ